MSFPISWSPLILKVDQCKEAVEKKRAISHIISPSHCYLIERRNEAVVIGERGQDEGIVLLVDLQDGAHVQLGILEEKTIN